MAKNRIYWQMVGKWGGNGLKHYIYLLCNWTPSHPKHWSPLPGFRTSKCPRQGKVFRDNLCCKRERERKRRGAEEEKRKMIRQCGLLINVFMLEFVFNFCYLFFSVMSARRGLRSREALWPDLLNAKPEMRRRRWTRHVLERRERGGVEASHDLRKDADAVILLRVPASLFFFHSQNQWQCDQPPQSKII